MPVHKAKFVGKGFTMLPNEAWNLLSNNGVLLLTYLLGKPETWEIRKHSVGQDLKWGIDKIDETFRELAKVGYVRFVRVRDNRNVIIGSEIHVTNIVGVFPELDKNPDETTNVEIKVVDSPQGVVSTGVENHGRGNSSHSNKEVSNKDLSNTLVTAFDEIWNRYPRKVNRAGAAKAFKAAIQRGAQIDDLIRAVDNYATLCAGRDTQYVMHGSTFFGPNDRWQDFLSFEAERIGSATVEQRDEIMRRALAEAKAQDEARRAQSVQEG